MSLRRRATPRWLVACLFGGYVATVVGILVALVAGVGAVDDIQVLLALAFAVVGALVALHAPSNAIGWVLLVAGVAFALQGAAQLYARVGSGPGVALAWWFSGWVFYLWSYNVGLFLPLLFPDGRPPTRRWRVVLVIDVAALGLSVMGQALVPGPLDGPDAVTFANPLGATGVLGQHAKDAIVVGGVLALLGLLLGPVSFVVRLRRSAGRERQQLKVFALVAGLLSLSVAVLVTSSALESLMGWRLAEVVENFVWAPLLLLVIIGLPCAVGIAILRHRLYDIDVVINRTLVYGLLTAALATTYVATILLLRLVLAPVTGQSDLAVAGSTLAVAAAFRPARARIQGLVDRRFYRRRYDAARTLEEFASRLRHEVDLDSVGEDLRAAVGETMQPMTVSLWLRAPHS